MTCGRSTFLSLFLGLFLAISCTSAKHYEIKGQVLAVNRDKAEILVKHEDIPGLMPAMDGWLDRDLCHIVRPGTH